MKVEIKQHNPTVKYSELKMGDFFALEVLPGSVFLKTNDFERGMWFYQKGTANNNLRGHSCRIGSNDEVIKLECKVEV